MTMQGQDITRAFSPETFTLGKSYDSTLTALNVGTVHFKFAARMTTEATSMEYDGITQLLGSSVEIVQGEKALVRANPKSLRHLSALTAGGYELYNNVITTATDNYTHFSLDLDRLQPGAMIPTANNVPVSIRGTFGALTDFAGGGTTAIAGDFKPHATSSPTDPDLDHLRPAISQFRVDLSSASNDIQHRLAFENDVLLAGFMVQAVDSSATTTNENVDGLIRGLQIELHSGNANTDIVRAKWGTLRQKTCHDAGFNRDDVVNSQGVAMIRTVNRAGGKARSMRLSKGNAMTWRFDNDTAIEREYTAITPAAGDHALVTVLGFELIKGAPRQTTASPNVRKVARRAGR